MPHSVDFNNLSRQSNFSAPSPASTPRRHDSADGWDFVLQDSSQNETSRLSGLQRPRLPRTPSEASSLVSQHGIDAPAEAHEDLMSQDALSRHPAIRSWLQASAPAQAHEDVLLALSCMHHEARSTLLAATAQPVVGWTQLLHMSHTRGVDAGVLFASLTSDASVENVRERITGLHQCLTQYFDANSAAAGRTVCLRLASARSLWLVSHRSESALKECWAILLDPQLRDPTDFVLQFKKLDEHVTATHPRGLMAHAVLHAVATTPRGFARAAMLLGTATASQNALEYAENHFPILRVAPALVRAAADVQTLQFLATFDPETLGDLERQLLRHGLVSSEVLTLLREHGVPATTDYADRQSESMEAPRSLTVLAASLASSSGRPNASLLDLLVAVSSPLVQASVPVGIRLTAMVDLLRTQPTDQHRRVWTGEYRQFWSWTQWPANVIALAADLGRSLSPEGLNVAMFSLAASHQAQQPIDLSMENHVRRITDSLGTRALLRRNQPFVLLVPAAEDAEPAPNLPPMRWKANENVMLPERRDVIDASVQALLAHHPLADLPAYDRFTGAEHSTSANLAIRYMAELEIPYEVGGQHVLLRDILRVVLHASETYQHASGDPAQTRTDRDNMRTALLGNLASAVTLPDEIGAPVDIVCFPGLVERMVRALHGYDDNVKILFVTPQELANHVAADVQKTRQAALTQSEGEAFVDRCKGIAQDLYDGDATRVAEVETHARTALPYLQERV